MADPSVPAPAIDADDVIEQLCTLAHHPPSQSTLGIGEVRSHGAKRAPQTLFTNKDFTN